MSDATVKQLSAIETLRVASEMVSDRIAELEARVEPLQPFKLKILELEAAIEKAKNRCNTLINEDARHADNIIWIKEALGDKV